MNRSPRPCYSLVGGIIFVTALGAGFGQEPSLEELLPGLRDQAVVLEIISRVVDRNQQIVWDSVNPRVTFPGRPIRINIMGTNVAMALQFTLFFKPGSNSVLVAQGQIWVDVPDEGIRYQTTLQTIPIEIGEPIFFFPLGSPNSPEEARIELELTILPYEDRPTEPNAPGPPWGRGSGRAGPPPGTGRGNEAEEAE